MGPPADFARGAAVVKCKTCGFLARRDRDGDTREVEKKARETGQLPNSVLNGIWISEPFCYTTSNEFHQILQFANPQAVLAEFNREHSCPKWIAWRPGRSPKEHEEMIALEEIRTQQRISEEKAERLRQEDLARAAQVREDDLKAAKKHRRTQMVVAYLALIVAAMSALGTLWNASENAARNRQSVSTSPAAAPNVPQPAAPAATSQPKENHQNPLDTAKQIATPLHEGTSP